MRNKGNAYQALIASALRLLRSTGRTPADIGEVARAADISPADAKQIFPDIAALRVGLLDHALVLLADALRTGVVAADPHDPGVQLCALSEAYFRWGSENLPLFQLLARGLLDPALAEGSEIERYSKSIAVLVRKKLVEGQSIGLIPANADIDILLANTHSILLGASAMLVNRRPDGWYQGEIHDLEQLANQMMSTYFSQIFAAPASA